MDRNVVHLVDATTPPDAFGQLAALLAANDRVAVLGNHASGRLAISAGVARGQLTFLPSMGWADPTGWRALRRLLASARPTHVHAWGIPAAFAAAMSAGGAVSAEAHLPERLVSLFDLPAPKHLRLLPAIHRGGLPGALTLLRAAQTAPPSSDCRWITASAWLKRELSAHGIPADSIAHIRPGAITTAGRSQAVLRDKLGLLPTDGPIVILGGEGSSDSVLASPDPLAAMPVTPLWNGGPRHDLGLWSIIILREIFPRICAIIREDPRDRANPGLDRLIDHLPDESVLVMAEAEYSWQELLSLADAMLITPDQPFAAVGVEGILSAKALGVAVIGTPMESVQEWIRDGETGVLTGSAKPRAISAAVEAFLGEAGVEARQRVVAGARAEAGEMYTLERMGRAYEAVYETRRGVGVLPGVGA